MREKWLTKRKETKYLVSGYQYHILKSLLASVMDRDPYADSQGEYFVRSLYFDSMNKRDLVEKELGATHRRKIRFRYYNHHPMSLKLETKEKDNRFTLKKSLEIGRDEALAMLANEYEHIKDEQPRLYDHLKTFHYQPVLVMDYEREAYVSDMFNLRINFDKNIRGTKDTQKLFDKDPAMIPITNPNEMILEVKHDGHVPAHIQKILASVDLTPISYSKYYLGSL